MRDLEEVRQNDISNGHFDVYVDDIDFTDEEYRDLRMNDVCRISDINPETATDPIIFEKLKKESEFYKGILSEMTNGMGRPLDNSFKSVVEKIIEYYRKDNKLLKNIKAYRFIQRPIFIELINRDILIRYNKVDITDENAIDSEKLQEAQKIQKEYHETMAIIEGKKDELKKEIVVKKVEDQNEE